MNCIKCPFSDECPTGKITTEQDHMAGMSVPTKVMPLNEQECLLVQAIAKVKGEENV